MSIFKLPRWSRMKESHKQRDWEFWLQCFIVNSGKTIRLGSNRKFISTEKTLLDLSLWTCDCTYEIFAGLTLDYSKTPLDHVVAFMLHSITRIACCVVEWSLVPSQMAWDHFNEILTIHRKVKCKIKFLLKNIVYFI